jgi:hypothetical protein
MSNWVVGSQAVTSTGVVAVGTFPTWSPSSGAPLFNLASGVPVTYQAVVIAPGISGVVPTVGRVAIDEIKGKVLVSSPGVTSAGFTVAVGIYISEYTIATSAWSVLDPLNSSAAAEDDWFYLEALNFMGPLLGAITNDAFTQCEFNLKLSEKIVIGGGQALNVTVSMICTPNTATLYCNPAFRTRIGPVA